MVGQRNAGGGGQRDTLVGRAKQHVKLAAAIDNGLCITTPQPSQVFTGIEQPGVEEVGAGAARFQGELTKAQYAGADGEIDKVVLVVFHMQSRVVTAGRDRYHTR